MLLIARSSSAFRGLIVGTTTVISCEGTPDPLFNGNLRLVKVEQTADICNPVDNARRRGSGVLERRCVPGLIRDHLGQEVEAGWNPGADVDWCIWPELNYLEHCAHDIVDVNPIPNLFTGAPDLEWILFASCSLNKCTEGKGGALCCAVTGERPDNGDPRAGVAHEAGEALAHELDLTIDCVWSARLVEVNVVFVQENRPAGSGQIPRRLEVNWVGGRAGYVDCVERTSLLHPPEECGIKREVLGTNPGRSAVYGAPMRLYGCTVDNDVYAAQLCLQPEEAPDVPAELMGNSYPAAIPDVDSDDVIAGVLECASDVPSDKALVAGYQCAFQICCTFARTTWNCPTISQPMTFQPLLSSSLW